MASFMLWPSSLIKVYYWYKMKMFVLITTISKLSLHPTVPSHLHLLCVDMTGHEGTTRTNTDDYSIQGQVKRIRHQGCIKLNAIQEIDENQNESKFDSQMHEVEHMPQQILQGLVDVQIPHSDFYHQVFMGIMSENSKYALHEHIQQITTPLQVIRGKQDQVEVIRHSRWTFLTYFEGTVNNYVSENLINTCLFYQNS
uniref:Uncharacterized protein n=1 Tax=Cyprinus carpio carpio TaxID=630221 RepID=A0A9J7ZXK3_CYPCA